MKDYPANVPCINPSDSDGKPCQGTAFLAYPTDENNALYICRRCGTWFRIGENQVHPLKMKK